MTKKEVQKKPTPTKKQPQTMQVGVVQEQRTYPAWMVPPEVMRGLNAEVDNGAERMLAMAEKEQNAVHEFERKRLEHLVTIAKQEHCETVLSQWFAFFVCISLVGLSA